MKKSKTEEIVEQEIQQYLNTLKSDIVLLAAKGQAPERIIEALPNRNAAEGIAAKISLHLMSEGLPPL